MPRDQLWSAPAPSERAPAALAQQGQGPTAVVFSPVGWWFVTWRARVLDESTGNVEARVSAVAEALDRLDAIGGLPGVRFHGPSTAVFEFWYQAASAREAFGGARAALRHACVAAQVGDPTPHTPSGTADVMLMLEELPTLHQDGS
jgi:hypothetical protein